MKMIFAFALFSALVIFVQPLNSIPIDDDEGKNLVTSTFFGIIRSKFFEISFLLMKDMKITFLRLVYELQESLDFEDDSYGIQPLAPFLELDDRDDGIFDNSITFS